MPDEHTWQGLSQQCYLSECRVVTEESEVEAVGQRLLYRRTPLPDLLAADVWRPAAWRSLCPGLAALCVSK